MTDDKERTGRTTRIIRAAIDAAMEKQGAVVTFIGYSHSLVNHDTSVFLSELNYRGLNWIHNRPNRFIHIIENGSMIRLLSYESGVRRCLEGCRSRVFVDHAVAGRMTDEEAAFCLFWDGDKQKERT